MGLYYIEIAAAEGFAFGVFLISTTVQLQLIVQLANSACWSAIIRNKVGFKLEINGALHSGFSSTVIERCRWVLGAEGAP